MKALILILSLMTIAAASEPAHAKYCNPSYTVQLTCHPVSDQEITPTHLSVYNWVNSDGSACNGDTGLHFSLFQDPWQDGLILSSTHERLTFIVKNNAVNGNTIRLRSEMGDFCISSDCHETKSDITFPLPQDNQGQNITMQFGDQTLKFKCTHDPSVGEFF
jgi:hypothetical protein